MSAQLSRLLHEVGLPKNAVQAVNSLSNLVAREVSLGLVEFDSGERRYFLLMCGAGLDAAIAARTPSRLKKRLGIGAFWLRGTEQLIRPFPRLRISEEDPEDGRSRTSSLVVISRADSTEEVLF